MAVTSLQEETIIELGGIPLQLPMFVINQFINVPTLANYTETEVGLP